MLLPTSKRAWIARKLCVRWNRQVRMFSPKFGLFSVEIWTHNVQPAGNAERRTEPKTLLHWGQTGHTDQHARTDTTVWTRWQSRPMSWPRNGQWPLQWHGCKQTNIGGTQYWCRSSTVFFWWHGNGWHWGWIQASECLREFKKWSRLPKIVLSF